MLGTKKMPENFKRSAVAWDCGNEGILRKNSNKFNPAKKKKKKYK
jgi:hypothetical protein